MPLPNIRNFVIDQLMFLNRHIFSDWLLLCTAITVGHTTICASDPGKTMLGYWHFQGAEHIRAMEGGTLLKQIFQSEKTVPVRDLLIEKLSGAPDKLFHGLRSKPDDTRMGLLSPLWADMMEHVSYGEVHGVSTSAINVSMAIRVPKDHLINWNTHLRRYAASLGWDINPALSEGMTSDWDASSTDSGFLMRYAQRGDWLLLSVGSDALTRILDWDADVKKQAFPPVAPDDGWGTIHLCAESIRELIQLPKTGNIQTATFKLTGDENFVRTTGELNLDQPLEDSASAWNIPVNRIQDPVVSFSAQRHLEPLLSNIPGMKTLFPDGTPEQSVAWSRPSKVSNPNSTQEAAPLFRNYISWPVTKENLPVDNLSKGLVDFLGPQFLESGRAAIINNTLQNHLSLKLTPAFVVPFVKGIEYGDGYHHIAGLTFMMSTRTNPPPPALFAQIENHPRLRYYHWELSGEKLYQYRAFLNLIGFLFDKGQMSKGTTLYNWTQHVEELIGNSVTQILVKSPKTLEIQRKSHLGLTGFEIALLTKWMHSDVFPWIDVNTISNWEFAPLTTTKN